MNKNLKYLSAFLTTGIMAASSLTGVVSAVTTDNTTSTPSLGVFQKLVSTTKNVVPYVLKDKTDRVTIADIQKEYNISKFNGSSILTPNTVVKTGDTFVADGDTYTVIVYGDIASKDSITDGAVSSADASLMLKLGVAADKSKLADELNIKAADINNDGVINSSDANLALKFAVGKASLNITLPAEQNDSIYSISFDDSYINNQNKDTLPITVKLSETLDEDNYTDFWIRMLDSKGNKVKSSDTSITIKANAAKVKKEISVFSTYLDDKGDGTYTIQLIEITTKNGVTKETVLAKTTVVRNTKTPAVTNVSAKRTGKYTATLSLENMAEENLSKVYYIVKATGTTPSSTDFNIDEVAKGDEEPKYDGCINVTNNKVENFEVADKLAQDSVYNVYYVLENEYGSRTTFSSATYATIVSHSNADKVKEAVTDLTTPDLTKSGTAEFTWKTKAAETCLVTLCKDGKAVAKATTPSGTSHSKDFTADIKANGAGTYTVKVMVQGNGTTIQDSEIVTSSPVEVKALNPVSNIEFKTKVGGSKVLTWTDNNSSNNVQDYSIELVAYDNKGNEKSTYNQTISPKPTKTECTLSISSNYIYVAKVKACADTSSQLALIDSEETISNEFFVIATTNGIALNTEAEDSSVVISLDDYFIINNERADYSVKVYEKNTEQSDISDAFYNTGVVWDSSKVEVKDKKITVSGLKANTEYAFQVIANINGIEGKSAILTETTKQANPIISNLTVVKTKAEATGNTIYFDTTTNKDLYVKGTKYDTTSGDYTAELANIAKIVKVLNSGDVISVSGDKVSLTLNSNASAQGVLDFETYAKGKTIEITANKFEREIATTGATESNRPTEVILKGTGAVYDVDDLNANKVTLYNTVDVTGDIKYTIAAGNTATINGVQVTTAKDVEITANGKTLSITADGTTNTLQFVNLNDPRYLSVQGDDAVIEFKGANNTSYLGTITITSEGGSVKVDQKSVDTTGISLTVNATDADVDVTGFADANSVNVTIEKKVATTSTITAVSENDAKMVLTNKTLKQYTYDEQGYEDVENDFASEITSYEASNPTASHDDIVKALRTFINSFGIEEDVAAKISVAADSKGVYNQVTITFAGKTDSIVNVKGLKVN